MSGDNAVQNVTTEAVHIPPNRLLHLNQLLQRLFLVACSYFFLVVFLVNSPLLATLAILGLAAASVLSFCSLVNLVFSFGTTALQSDANGITDATGPLPGGLVRWEEISGISESTVDFDPVLLIHLKDVDTYLSRLSEPKRSLLSASIPLYGTPCVVSQNDIGIPIAEARQLLEEARQRFVVPATQAIPDVATAPTAHWWTAVPPEERKAQPLRNGSADR